MTGGHSVETRLDALHRVTQRLMHAETEQEICEVAVDAVPDLFAVPFAGFWLYDTEATELQQAAETPAAGDRLDSDVVYRPGNSLSWEAFQTGERRIYRVDENAEKGYNTDSLVACEMTLPVGEYGVLNIATDEPDAFGTVDQQLSDILSANLEAALSKAEREHALKLKNDRLEEFVSIVSHDLRNPLTVADGNLALARTECDSEYLPAVADAIGRMDTLIEDLLTLAEQGYVVEDRTTLSLSALARQAWSSVHTPEATLCVDGSANIFGDEQRLLQVFENLFRNAVEHASDDVTIRIGPLETVPTSTRVSPNGDGFYVSDDGPGIPDEEKADVFDSGHSTDGTGLGLAIVERIVEAHGWTISVTDALDGGARFTVVGGAKSVTPFDTR